MRAPPADDAVLCRVGELTCGACCWGANVSRDTLTYRLARHRRLFAHRSDTPPSCWRLLLHELRARRGIDPLLALLLSLPLIGKWLRDRLARRIVCAFAAFEGEGERRVGCLLHPSHWGGRDLRVQAAFRLLPGFGCGSPDYACAACRRFREADPEGRNRLLHQLNAPGEPADWHVFGVAVVSMRDAGRSRTPSASGGDRSCR